MLGVGSRHHAHTYSCTHSCMHTVYLYNNTWHTPSCTLTTVSVANWVRGGVGHFSVYHWPALSYIVFPRGGYDPLCPWKRMLNGCIAGEEGREKREEGEERGEGEEEGSMWGLIERNRVSKHTSKSQRGWRETDAHTCGESKPQNFNPCQCLMSLW